MVPANSDRISRVPPYSGSYSRKVSAFRLRGCHPLWPSFQRVLLNQDFVTSRGIRKSPTNTPYYTDAAALPGCNAASGLGSFPFARHYLGNHFCFLFLRVLRCFSSPGLASLAYVFSERCCSFTAAGFPIRLSAGQRMLAPIRGLSQLATTFFASQCQGIRRMPLFA